MASTVSFTNRLPNGGFNRAAQPQMAGDNNWFDLLNFRPLVGALSQTPPFVAKYALSNLSGESAQTRVRYMDVVLNGAGALQYLVVNEKTARYVDPATLTQTKIPCILTTAVPNNTTANGYVLMLGYNTTDFGTDGDFFTVQITDSTHFKWSKNGGSTTTVAITANNIGIGSHGLTLAFFTTTGFNTGDTWIWTRSALLPANTVASTFNFAYNPAIYQTDVYLAGINRNIMRVRNGIITSVGYNRIFGKYVQCFQNHLVVAHFAQGVYDAVAGVVDSFNAATTPFTVGWSDLGNPDNLVPNNGGANLNSEADSIVLPYNTYPDTVNYGITGMAQLYESLYIYLPDAIYQMQYVGLPAVMQVLPRFQGVGCYYHNALVLAKRGHYFIGRDNIYFFNGLIPTPIGEPVRTKFFDEVQTLGGTNFDLLYGYYNGYEQEVVWTYYVPFVVSATTYYQARQLVYQEKYSRFYFRNAPSVDSGATNLMCTCRVFDGQGISPRLQYAGLGEVYFDYNSSESTGSIVNDVAGPTPSATQPTCETNDFTYGPVALKKEGRTLLVDQTSTSGVSTVQPYAMGRNFFSTPIDYSVSPLPALNSGNPEQGRVPLNNVQGRIFRFKLQWQGTLPLGCVLNGWSDGIDKTNADR